MVRKVINSSGKPEAQSPLPRPPVHYEGAAKTSPSKSAAGEEHESLSQQLAKALSTNEEQRRNVDRLINALDAADIGGKAASNSARMVRPVGRTAVEGGQPLNQAELQFDHHNETTDVELVVNDTYKLKQRLWATSKLAYGYNIDDDIDGPIRIQRTWSIDAVHACINYACARKYVPRYFPPDERLKHLWSVMLLAADWNMPILLENVSQQFLNTVLTLQKDNIYLLTELLVAAYRCPQASELTIRAERTVKDAAIARRSDILRNTTSLWLLNQPGALALFLADLARGGIPTGTIQQHVAMHGATQDQIVCGFPGCLYGAPTGETPNSEYVKSCFKNIWTIVGVPQQPGIMNFVPGTFSAAPLSY
ncbi:hypothetical protein LTS10_006215 [Elasticomyces elasticus]|nr:hypothetical protein LTS10_006215 [Elasticomyces elasticus]